MAGGERIELPPTESKSVELTVIRTPMVRELGLEPRRLILVRDAC